MATDKKVVLIDLTIETKQIVKAIDDVTKKVSSLKAELKTIASALSDTGKKGSDAFKEAEKAVASKQKELAKAQATVEQYKTKLAEIVEQSKKNAQQEKANAQAEQKAKDESAKALDKLQKQKEQEAKAEEKRVAQETAQRQKLEQQAQRQAEEEKARNEQAEQNAIALQNAVQQVGDTIAETFGGEGLIPDELITKIADAKTELQRLAETNAILKQGLADTEVGTERYAELQKALAGNEIQMRGVRTELNNYQKEADNIVKLNNAQEGSYEQLYRQYVDAEKNLKLLEGTLKRNKDGTIETTKEYRQASKEVRQLKEGLLEFNKGILDGRLNVGNYAQSVGDALSSTGLFGNAITNVKDAITGTTSAISLVQDGVKLISDGFVSAGDTFSTFSDGLQNFFTTSGDATETATSTADSITNIGDSAKDTGDTLDKTGKTAINSGKAFLTGGNIGANGMKILKLAIASTGIGLLVIAVGSLITYFTKFQKGIDLVKQAFAGVSAVIDVVVGSIGAIGEAISNFSLDGIGNAFSNFGKGAGEAYDKAVKLEQAQQKLEEREIKQKKVLFELQEAIDDYKLASEDKTKSDQERIDSALKGAELEKQKVNELLITERERLRILDEQLQQKIKNGTASREELSAREDLAVKVLELEDEYQDKVKETQVAVSKIQKKINEERLQNARALANNEIKLAELQGKNTVALRKKLAKEELDAIKGNAQKSADEKKVAESNYNLAIAEIDAEAREERKKKQKEYNEKQKELDIATADARISLITDGLTRELAQESEALKRRLSEIKGNSEKEIALRNLLTQQSAQRVFEIEENYAKQRIDKTNEENERITDNLIKSTEETYDAKQKEIDNALEDELITQEQANTRTIALELEKQSMILEIQKKALADRIANEKTFYDEQEQLVQQQLEKGDISAQRSQELLEEIRKKRGESALLTEQTLGQQVLDTQKQIDTARVDLARATSKEIQATTEQAIQKQIEADNLALDSVKTAFQSFSAILSQNEKQRKANAKVLRTLAKGEILIGAYQEISGYWQGVGQDAKRVGTIGATASSVIATILSASAIARALSGIAQVNAQKFADGGFTVQDAVSKYNPTMKNNFTGGYVNKPTMFVGSDGGLKLTGEAGSEWVSPNWQVRQAPEIFSALEQWRRTGVRTFADGGFTSMSISSPLIDSAKSIESAISKGFASAPNPIVSVVEISDVQNRVTTIESRSTLG